MQITFGIASKRASNRLWNMQTNRTHTNIHT